MALLFRTTLIGLMMASAITAAACDRQAEGGGEDGSLAGEEVHFVVSYGPGGGYDLIARSLAPYVENELDATVVVENEDGAGGLLAANQVFAAAPDGLTIGFFSGQGAAGATLGEADGVQFELDEFSYVARLGAEPRILSVSAGSDYASIDEVRGSSGFRFGSSGPGGSEHIDATVLFPVLDIDGPIITGYEGSSDTELAVTSGDVDATSGTLGTRLPPIDSGDHRALLTIGTDPVEELPDVPALLDLELDEKSLALAESHTLMQQMGRMVWAPPGVSEERLAQLESAFEVAVDNPDFQEEMRQLRQPVDFLSGAEAKEVAEGVLEAPEEYQELLEGAYVDQ